jgi:Asp/Glu/hydantoin racemase
VTTTETRKSRILMCEPVPEQSGTKPQLAWWNKTADLVTEAGTKVEYGGLKRAYPGATTYEQAYNGIQMAWRSYEAEKQGYDAFIIGCASDMGVRECRALVNIPIVAPTEATALLASTLGNKFSAINLQASTDAGIESAIRDAGLIDKLASVRTPPGLTIAKTFSMSMGNEQKEITEILIAEMTKAVNEDGAEVVFVSCTHTSAFLAMQGIHAIEGVPVLDLFAVSLKMAETLISLKRGFGTFICKKSVYMGPSAGWEKMIPEP